EVETAPARGARAFHRVEQPLVNAKRAMEPHRVIERCELNVALREIEAGGSGRRREQVIVRDVREHVSVQVRAVRQRTDRLEPKVTDRLGAHGWLELRRL